MYAQHQNPLNNELDLALHVLGIVIHDDDTTDPILMQKILHDLNIDLEILADTKENTILKRLITDRIPLKPLKDNILCGIKSNPSLYRTLSEVAKTQASNHLQDNLPIAQLTQLNFSLYFMVILEAFTYLMVNNKEVETTIVTMLLNKRKSYNTGSTFWNFISKLIETKGDVFTAIKTISIDPFMFEAMCFRQYPPKPTEEQLKNFIRDNNLTGVNKIAVTNTLARHHNGKITHGGLYGNIFEALTKEEMLAHDQTFLTSFLTKKQNVKTTYNIKAGLALLYYLDTYQNERTPFLFETSKYDLTENVSAGNSSFWRDLYDCKDEDNLIKGSTIFSKEFINTYHAWNMAFVFRNFKPRFYLYLPKLLIPTMTCGNPKYYFGARVISLWLTILFCSSLRQKNLIINYPEINLEPALNIFGRNNLIYAEEQLTKNQIDLDKAYQERIHNKLALINYIKSIKYLMS